MILNQVIASEIKKSGGSISFARFMDLALYHPQYGYYMQKASPIGKKGDFYTSVSVGPLFGKVLARQFLQYRQQLCHPENFQIVELGGHRGELRRDVLAEAPDLRYQVIEAHEEIPNKMTGIVFSNEFFDALAVHRVVVKNGVWRELGVSVYVGSAGEISLAECELPAVHPDLEKRLADLPIHLMEGYRTEINLAAEKWIQKMAGCLEKGFVVAIDYGFGWEDYFSPSHHEGHLQCYQNHQKGTNPYINVGTQDISCHVQWDSIISAGVAAGLKLVQLTDQSHYLLHAGKEIFAEIVERTAGQMSPERSAIHQLIHPSLMGRAFKVLVMEKE